jgi:flagellar biosynthesis protein
LRRVSPAVSDQPASRRPPDAAIDADAPPRPAAPPALGQPAAAKPASGRSATGQPAIAVALKHDPGSLPRVIASGRGNMAERILEIAFQAGIKVREDADLAQMLAAVESNMPIPIACFEAVAEILNYLYRANATAAGTPPA